MSWYMGELKYSFTILDLGTKWRWVVSFTSRLLYPQGKSPRYSLDRKLGGPKSRPGCCGKEKILTPEGNWTRAVQPVAIQTYSVILAYNEGCFMGRLCSSACIFQSQKHFIDLNIIWFKKKSLCRLFADWNCEWMEIFTEMWNQSFKS
jgi:hypothetical protein